MQSLISGAINIRDRKSIRISYRQIWTFLGGVPRR